MAREKKPIHKVQMTEGKRNADAAFIINYKSFSAKIILSVILPDKYGK